MRPTQGDQVPAKRAVPPFLPIAPRKVRSPVPGFRTDRAALDRDAASGTMGWRRAAVARFAAVLAA
ncbi:hypothetical protein [Paracoccus endophyticus]|uniref:hypothetical protein n=1 Tax=Paracoccus endophyticus TaxID=2233774 RepID=UPI000DD54A57|nr:hypothetical protein [Paracoccus endophyticus]